MAFIGVAVVTQVSQKLARITGLSLGSGASGTISLHEGPGQVKLPDGCNWGPYGGDGAGDGIVSLDESVEISWIPVGDPGANTNPTMRIYATKADGDSPAAFFITMINGDTLEASSAELEIYVRFHN